MKLLIGVGSKFILAGWFEANNAKLKLVEECPHGKPF
jgi:hypothetical protein